jgi:hypothetical protein
VYPMTKVKPTEPHQMEKVKPTITPGNIHVGGKKQ